MNLSDPGLSDKEIQILQLLASGQNQKEIANILFMSLSTFRRDLGIYFPSYR
nr:LuxR C-terminal-related transcriptional regulator [Desulforamulus aquiferis]